MTEYVNKIADAIESAEVGYKLSLTRLVDGVSTYTLTYSDNSMPLEFVDSDDNDYSAQDAAYAHIARTRREKAARSVLQAMREPTQAMIDAAYEAEAEYQRAPAPASWCGLASAYRAMIDAALNGSKK